MLINAIFLLFMSIHRIQGYAQAPGIYPEAETRTDESVPVVKSAYQPAWNGYDFYYEEEKKATMKPAGLMPAFEPIGDSDKLGGEDPESDDNTTMVSPSTTTTKEEQAGTTESYSGEMQDSNKTEDQATEETRDSTTTEESTTPLEAETEETGPEKEKEVEPSSTTGKIALEHLHPHPAPLIDRVLEKSMNDMFEKVGQLLLNDAHKPSDLIKRRNIDGEELKSLNLPRTSAEAIGSIHKENLKNIPEKTESLKSNIDTNSTIIQQIVDSKEQEPSNEKFFKETTIPEQEGGPKMGKKANKQEEQKSSIDLTSKPDEQDLPEKSRIRANISSRGSDGTLTEKKNSSNFDQGIAKKLDLQPEGGMKRNEDEASSLALSSQGKEKEVGRTEKKLGNNLKKYKGLEKEENPSEGLNQRIAKKSNLGGLKSNEDKTSLEARSSPDPLPTRPEGFKGAEKSDGGIEKKLEKNLNADEVSRKTDGLEQGEYPSEHPEESKTMAVGEHLDLLQRISKKSNKSLEGVMRKNEGKTSLEASSSQDPLANRSQGSKVEEKQVGKSEKKLGNNLKGHKGLEKEKNPAKHPEGLNQRIDRKTNPQAEGGLKSNEGKTSLEASSGQDLLATRSQGFNGAEKSAGRIEKKLENHLKEYKGLEKEENPAEHPEGLNQRIDRKTNPQAEGRLKSNEGKTSLEASSGQNLLATRSQGFKAEEKQVGGHEKKLENNRNLDEVSRKTEGLEQGENQSEHPEESKTMTVKEPDNEAEKKQETNAAGVSIDLAEEENPSEHPKSLNQRTAKKSNLQSKEGLKRNENKSSSDSRSNQETVPTTRSGRSKGVGSETFEEKEKPVTVTQENNLNKDSKEIEQKDNLTTSLKMRENIDLNQTKLNMQEENPTEFNKFSNKTEELRASNNLKLNETTSEEMRNSSTARIPLKLDGDELIRIRKLTKEQKKEISPKPARMALDSLTFTDRFITDHLVHKKSHPHAPSRQSNTLKFKDERASYNDVDGFVDDAQPRMNSTRNDGSSHDIHQDLNDEIDQIAAEFEIPARDGNENEQDSVNRDSTKDYQLGRASRKCCSCCDEKESVSREIDSNDDDLAQLASTNHNIKYEVTDKSDEVPVDAPHVIPKYESTYGDNDLRQPSNAIGGDAYVDPNPVPIPRQPIIDVEPEVVNDIAADRYSQRPLYPQPIAQVQPLPACGCAAPPPTNCCPPPQPCCTPSLPCCPMIPCCPQPKICCQPMPPPTCCSISFQVPTIPVCGRACPSCPCRRRVHRSLRLKRHLIGTQCTQCSAAGEPWRTIHRVKRQSGCSSCGASHLRTRRVKRMGCLPCFGRKKRDADENAHIRTKRTLGCVPCYGRKKRSTPNCSSCSNLGQLFGRYKRSFFGGCSPCAPPPPCPCAHRRHKRQSVLVKREPTCDKSCCDYSECKRHKKQSLIPM